MSNIERFPNSHSIAIPPDEDGYLGRECPREDCEGYFKVKIGTGASGQPNSWCPYCGQQANHDKFWTKAQVEYAKSVVLNKFTKALLKDLKELEFEHKPRGMFGIGISAKVYGHPEPIRYYREERLETQVKCNACSLEYAVFGVFGFCPDCGSHNSPLILEKNLELAGKGVALSESAEGDLAEHLLGDSLENVVSSFDGFGREVCRVHSKRASDPRDAERVSFQDLSGARGRVRALFNVDLAAGVDAAEWMAAIRGFQKRHLLAHKLGVIDAEYVAKAQDPQAVVGRKVRVTPDEVRGLIDIVRRVGEHLSRELRGGQSP